MFSAKDKKAVESNAEEKESKRSRNFFSISDPSSPSGIKKIKFSDVSQRLAEGFTLKEYEKLKSELISYRLGKEQIKEFFLSEGYNLLDFAVSHNSDPRGLHFLCDVIEPSTLQEILSSKKYQILERFLLVQSGLEGTDFGDVNEKQFQIEKIKILLTLDFTSVNDFFEKKIASGYIHMTPEIIENFQCALALTKAPSARRA